MPQAGSQTSSPSFGSTSAHIIWMTWRGVRNWPFLPALAHLARAGARRGPPGCRGRSGPSRPARARSPRTISSMRPTASTRSEGFGMMKTASCMDCAKAWFVAAEALDEREDLVPDVRQHLLGRAGGLKPAPAASRRGPRRTRRSVGLEPTLRCRPRACLLVAGVEAPHEEQVADLLHRRQGVGDAARPEAVPAGVDSSSGWRVSASRRHTCLANRQRAPRPPALRGDRRPRPAAAGAPRRTMSRLTPGTVGLDVGDWRTAPDGEPLAAPRTCWVVEPAARGRGCPTRSSNSPVGAARSTPQK